MKYVFTLSLLILALISNAQSSWEWVRTAGASADARYNDVATDGAGNVYVAGSFTDSAIFDDGTKLLSQGGKDIFLAKYTTDGILVWARSAGGKFYDEAWAIAVNSAGIVALTGGYTDTAHFGVYMERPFQESVSPKVNLFVAKYTTDGDVFWVKSAGGYDFLADDNYGDAIDIIENGTVAVCGHFGGKMMFEGSDTITSNGNYDGFWAKYSAGGNLQWVHSGGGDQDNRATDISMHENGDIFVAGHINGFSTFTGLDTTFQCIGTSDMFITAVKSNGDPLWIHHGGSIGNAADASCLAIDKTSTRLVVGGQFTDSLRMDEFGISSSYVPGSNGYLSLYQNYGAIFGFDEIRSFDGSNRIASLSLARESFSLVASGISTGIVRINGDTLNSSGGNYLFGMDPNDSKIYFNKSIITNATDKTIHVAYSTNNSVYAAGVFRNSITLDAFSMNASKPNVNQAYVAKLGVQTSVKNIPTTTNHAMIYPNPSSGKFSVIGSYTSIRVIDMLGRAHQASEKLQVDRIDIDCSELPAGMYIIHLTTPTGSIVTERIVIER